MDENPKRPQDRRRDHELRYAIDLLRVDVARACMLLADARPLPDERRSALAGSLNNSFDGMIQAVRRSWHQRGGGAAALT